tara:strand:+ start:128 stop:667 length:540 start_codon:yes stop_codon:yes gene_type:complete
MILGLDVSTSITGATVIDSKNNILYCEHWDTRNKNKFPSLMHKAAFLKGKVKDIKKNYKIKTIFIEENLQSFRSGFSSAKTLSTLSKINGIVSFAVFEIFGREAQNVAATSARKLCGIKVQRGTKAKEVVLKFLLDNEPAFSVQYTKHGNPKPGSYDRADSLIIARAGLELCKQKNSKF